MSDEKTKLDAATENLIEKLKTFRSDSLIVIHTAVEAEIKRRHDKETKKRKRIK